MGKIDKINKDSERRIKEIRDRAEQERIDAEKAKKMEQKARYEAQKVEEEIRKAEEKELLDGKTEDRAQKYAEVIRNLLVDTNPELDRIEYVGKKVDSNETPFYITKRIAHLSALTNYPYDIRDFSYGPHGDFQHHDYSIKKVDKETIGNEEKEIIAVEEEKIQKYDEYYSKKRDRKLDKNMQMLFDIRPMRELTEEQVNILSEYGLTEIHQSILDDMSGYFRTISVPCTKRELLLVGIDTDMLKLEEVTVDKRDIAKVDKKAKINEQDMQNPRNFFQRIMDRFKENDR